MLTWEQGENGDLFPLDGESSPNDCFRKGVEVEVNGRVLVLLDKLGCLFL
jgi:hypothetical protein